LDLFLNIKTMFFEFSKRKGLPVARPVKRHAPSAKFAKGRG
jgi:hypothetical protein